MPKDYYEILQIDKNARAESIKKAYRKKARTLHPDVNQSANATDEFQELYEAYSVLIDPELREKYDSGTLFEKEWVPPPPPRENPNQYRSGWSYAYRYERPDIYHTDYEANKRTAFWVCLGVLLFSLTFFVDLSFHKKLGTSTVLSVQNKAFSTQNLNDMEDVIITTEELSFEKRLEPGEISIGDEIEIRESIIYKFLSFRRMNNSRFSYMNTVPMLLYITALIVLISGLYGITPYSKAERKFNAAIVGSFFSFALIIFLTFG